MQKTENTIIFSITNTKTNQRFIGSSIMTLADIKMNTKDVYNSIHRQKKFGWKTNMKKVRNRFVIESMLQYGWDSFVFKLLETLENQSKEIINTRKQYYIDYYDTIKTGFNKQNALSKQQRKKIKQSEKEKN